MVGIVARGLIETIETALDHVPVVILEGARATGKSTIGRMLQARGRLASSVDLSDPTTQEAARAAPTSFIDGLDLPAFIDEAHLVPDLAIAVKRRVDRTGEPGLFVLTGSSRLGRHQLGGSDPLAGRTLRLRLWPMTQGELAGTPVDRLTRLLDDPTGTVVAPATPKELMHRLMRGGLPGIALADSSMPDLLRAQLLAEYLEGVIVHETDRRRDRSELIRLARYLTAATGTIVNLTSLSSDLGSTRETIATRLTILEACFLVHALPAHRPSEHRVLSAHPKILATDVGLAAWATRAGPNTPVHTLGNLIETLAINELVAQAGWTTEHVQLRHWRDTKRKVEVDALALRADGSSVAFEIKAAVDVRPDDLHGLRAYLNMVTGATHGIVLYTGTRSLQLDDHIWAHPIASLWST